MPGRVYLTGAGPGDPELLTVKALRILQSAEVVLHDSLIPAAILGLARPDSLLVDVGKRCGRHAATQAEINRLLIRHAQTARVVVRLKGGDPGIFGRATEELEALAAAAIPFEIIPGITAATAAAASLGCSLSKRDVSQSIHFLTGHGAQDGLPAHDWPALARAGGTLVIYMGRETISGLAAHLIEAGMSADLPAIAVENASLATEQVTRASLAMLPRALRATRPTGPVLLLLGEALRCAELPSEIRQAATA